jgi:hypothetical protein
MLARRQERYTNYDPNEDVVYTCDNIGLLEYIYGVPYLKMERDVFVSVFNQHRAEVSEYFEGREDKLLVMNFERGDGWAKMCAFLGEDVPATDFPHLKKTVYRKSVFQRVKQLVKKLIW